MLFCQRKPAVESTPEAAPSILEEKPPALEVESSVLEMRPLALERQAPTPPVQFPSFPSESQPHTGRTPAVLSPHRSPFPEVCSFPDMYMNFGSRLLQALRTVPSRQTHLDQDASHVFIQKWQEMLRWLIAEVIFDDFTFLVAFRSFKKYLAMARCAGCYQLLLDCLSSHPGPHYLVSGPYPEIRVEILAFVQEANEALRTGLIAPHHPSGDVQMWKQGIENREVVPLDYRF
ncbi:hypothetical protein K402DRAFT_170263 [Aulographum hederae CBS 113979]|uniref:Uncharacterized protein n=1 Tax=Aulographum hederae CBS 113979 TaxID=1176131 RepID=A0A6G1HCW8_9PEZI|nr:hypothetical protein K402DRAFT_170263 [Aulographum hederae CBS 113979]